MTLAYDDDADVLYITFEETAGPCSYVENDNGDIIRIDKPTGKIIGCTILFFLDRLKKHGGVRVPEIGTVPFNAKTLELLHT